MTKIASADADDSISSRPSALGVALGEEPTPARLLAAAGAAGQDASEDAEAEAQESSSFTIHFHPDALMYEVDEDLVRALIDRGAFDGLNDGRERELGEARITSFKVHRDGMKSKSEAAQAAKQTIAASATGAATSHRVALLQRLPAASWIVGAAGLLMGLAFASFALRRRARHKEYEQLESETASPAA